MTKPKPGKKEEGGLRVNGKIRAREIYVIGADNAQLGIMSPEEALQIAGEDGLDLVEVDPQARPPVCRIMDYGKHLYDQKKAQKGSAHRVDIKELRVRPKTGAHDIQVKVNRGRKFLEKGHKVQLTMLLRGREKAHPERAKTILLEVAEQLTDIARTEQDPRLNNNRMQMLFAPDKNAILRLLRERELERQRTGAPAPQDTEDELDDADELDDDVLDQDDDADLADDDVHEREDRDGTEDDDDNDDEDDDD